MLFAAVLLGVEGLDGGFLQLCPFTDHCHILVVGQIKESRDSILFGAQVFQLLGKGVDALSQFPLFQQTPCRGPFFLIGKGALLGDFGLDPDGQGVELGQVGLDVPEVISDLSCGGAVVGELVLEHQ